MIKRVLTEALSTAKAHEGAGASDQAMTPHAGYRIIDFDINR